MENDDRSRPDGITAWLRAEAATGRALRAADLQCERWSTTDIAKTMCHLACTGKLFRAKLAFKQVYYLATPELADAYVAEHQAAYLARLAADLAAKQQGRLAAPAPAPVSPLRRAKRKPGPPQRAPAVWAADAEAEPRTMPPVIYCPSPITAQRACPPDRPLVLRAGALDYRRFMAKHQDHAA